MWSTQKFNLNPSNLSVIQVPLYAKKTTYSISHSYVKPPLCAGLRFMKNLNLSRHYVLEQRGYSLFKAIEIAPKSFESSQMHANVLCKHPMFSTFTFSRRLWQSWFSSNIYFFLKTLTILILLLVAHFFGSMNLTNLFQICFHPPHLLYPRGWSINILCTD